MRSRLALALALVSLVAAAEPARQTIVVCSPGSPGSTDEAKPAMDAFSAAASAKAGVALSAIYDPTDAGGVSRIKQAGIAIVSTPFFLAHERELQLHARLEVVQKGRPAHEQWALVAQKGRGKDLGGLTIVSSAGFAPAFVRGVVGLPAGAKIEESSAVLTALRRAADGEPVAVLLDGAQAAALASLPAAGKLEIVARSPAMPVAIVATVDARVPDKQWQAIASALLALPQDAAGKTALEGMQIERFAPVDTKALATVRSASAKAAR